MSAADVERVREKERRAGLGNYSASFQLSALFFFFLFFLSLALKH